MKSKKIVLDFLDHGSEEKDHRCLCGSLIARICDAGLELKCKRCKRFHVIPLTKVENY
ncbi:MAG: hypothetical protein ACE5F7_09040 [Nitrospiria bacterium]